MRKYFTVIALLLAGCGPLITETMCNTSGEAYIVRREKNNDTSNGMVYRAKDSDKLCKGIKNEPVAP